MYWSSDVCSSDLAQIGQIAHRLVDEMLRSPDRQANLVATYADRIPMMAIATLLDAPVEDYHRYREWVDASLELITTEPSPARLDVLAETLVAFDSLLRKLFQDRRERSGEEATQKGARIGRSW